MAGAHQLAQVNVALPRAPLESAELAEFMAALAPVNALADAAPGFVWRLQTEEGDATAIDAFGDERLIVNLSVWESLAALRAFTYGGEHRAWLRRRREWFEPLAGMPHLALWWIAAGTIPTVADGEAAVARLAADGPTPAAFTLAQAFPPPPAEPAADAQ